MAVVVDKLWPVNPAAGEAEAAWMAARKVFVQVSAAAADADDVEEEAVQAATTTRVEVAVARVRMLVAGEAWMAAVQKTVALEG